MKSILNNVHRIAVVAMVMGFSTSVFADVVVIVNPKNATTSLTAEQVSNIYLGKSSSFPGGGTAVMADLPESAPARETFYTKATSKTAAQVRAIWSRIVFSGKGQPPRELASAAEVKKFVASNPDAIGYIEKSAADASVKVVYSVQ